MLRYFKKYMKIPNVRSDELPGSTSREEDNEAMKSFVINSLNTLQLLYDIMPISTALACDPYQSECS